MALVGGYVLAGELAAHADNPRAGLTRYEEVLRPFVRKAQQLQPGGLSAMTPKSRSGIRAGHALSKLMMSKAMRPVMMRMLSKTETYELPEYSAVTVGH
ncbi:hypothetical protein [Nocardia asiatica]|nr:hypothetical protein [Nocardia asiatica]